MMYLKNEQRGFTLVETVVFVSIFVVLLIAMVASIRYAYRGHRFVFEQADATRSARTGIEQVVRDLREASYADSGAYPIVEMSADGITFYSDYDNDGRVERIQYILEGTNLKKSTTESAGDPPSYAIEADTVSIISDNVRNGAVSVPLFTYYDRGGVLMSDYTQVGDVAFVLARVVVNIHPERAPEDFELRSSAALRNIK